MVSSEDIANFVNDNLRPLSEGKKVKGDKTGKSKKVEEGKVEKEVVEVPVNDVVESVSEPVEEPKPKKKPATKKPKKGSEDEKKEPGKKPKKEKEATEGADEEVEKPEKATKKDKVLVALEGLEEDSIDLLFFDPFNRLGDKEMTFKTPAERDNYIERVQGWLLEARKKLRNKGGGMVIGVDSFTLTSFGDAIFPTEEVKRMLSWYSEQGHGGEQLPTDRGYLNTSIPFLWNVKKKPWTFNKPEDVAFFDGEFKSEDGKGLDALDMAQQVVRIFSNEGDTVLELFGKDTVIEKAVELEGRKYVSGLVK